MSEMPHAPRQGEILSPDEGARLGALEAAAAGIRDGLALMRSGLGDFVEGALRAAAAVNEARKRFASNQDFGIWLRASGFGENVISKNDRIALVDFGDDLIRARQVLEASERRSLRLIHEYEWKPARSWPRLPKAKPLRVPSAGKTVASSKKAPIQNADPIEGVARALAVKCADGKWRSLAKMASTVGRAETAVREALKHLGAETCRGADGLEYRIEEPRVHAKITNDEFLLRTLLAAKDDVFFPSRRTFWRCNDYAAPHRRGTARRAPWAEDPGRRRSRRWQDLPFAQPQPGNVR
jgi:hypothetical protein